MLVLTNRHSVLPSLAILLLLVGGAAAPLALLAPAVHASFGTTVSITTSNGSTVCPASPLGGTWDGATDTCSFSSASGTALTISSLTTLDIGAGVTVSATSSVGDGIDNSGTINNDGTLSGSYSGGCYCFAIGINNNVGTINNLGTMTGSASEGYYGIYNNGLSNNDGTMSSSSFFGSSSLSNPGAINDYCGASPSPFPSGSTVNAISCYTATFSPSGLPSGVTWGVTTSWGPFVLPYHSTGSGASIAVDANTAQGSLNFSLDTPVTASGVTYDCSLGCSRTTTLSFSATFLADYVVATTTSISASPTSVSYGSSVTYSATVTPSTATGTVAFTVGSTALCTATLTGGAGTCTATNAPGGSDTVTGTYSGDSNDGASSGTASLTVNAVGSSTTVSCSPTPVQAGYSTTCTATVAGTSPSGAVSWSTAGFGTFSPSASCTLSSGGCSVTYTPTASTSPVTITGAYGGDSNNAASSATFSLSVTPSAPPYPPIPSYAMPAVLDFSTYGNLSLTANEVGMIGGGQVIYNIPSINQTLLNGELTQGNFDLLPNALDVCSTHLYGQTYIRVSGFSAMSWGAGLTNSTEFVFGSYVSYLTGAQGWPAEAACAS